MKELVIGFTSICLGVFLFIGGLLWGIPTYNVWSANMSGRAKLAEAP